MLVDRIDPEHGIRLFHGLDVEVHHHRLVVAADQDAFQGLVGAAVDFLVRHVGRDEDEIARLGLGDEFQFIAPAHAGLAAHDIDHAFQRPVVMRAGLGVGVDVDRPGPDFLSADAGFVDRGGAVHAGGLRGVGVELIGLDHPHAVRAPIDRAGRGRPLMRMIVRVTVVVIMTVAHGANS